jgi:hypothetical protein
MIAALKQDSNRFELEREQRQRRFGSPGHFGSSATFDDRQRQGRPDVPQSRDARYARYPLDTSIDYYDDRGALQGYRDQEPRIYDPRMDTRQDPRMDRRIDPRPDPRQQLPISRHGQIPPAPRGHSQDRSYSASYQGLHVGAQYDDAVMVTSSEPAVGYPLSTTAASGPVSADVDPISSRPIFEYQAGAGHPGWGDTPNFRESGPGI